MHKCAAAGCHTFIEQRLLMCGPHWHEVPLYLARKVNATFAAYQRSSPADRQRTREAFLEARAAAVESI